MKLSLMAILSFVLFSNATPKCGPFLTVHVGLPAGFGSATIFKVQVQNTDTGGSTVYPEPTSDIVYPQDGGFHYIVTYTFTSSVTGVVSFINTAHNECGNVDFQGTHGVISFNTLCETYDVSLRAAGSHVLCN